MIRFSSSCISWLKGFMAPSNGCQSDLGSDEEKEEEEHKFMAPSGGYQSDLTSDEEEKEEEEHTFMAPSGGCQSDLTSDEEEKEEEEHTFMAPRGGCQSELSSDEEEEEQQHKSMAPSGEIVINISSDEEEEEEEEEDNSKRGGGCQSDLKQQIKEELDDDCVILDGDPNKPLTLVGNESGSEWDELIIVAEKGQVACRDYPHARHLCARFPFNTNPHEKYCALCHCYVCDTLAPCDHWGRGIFSGDHCHATDKEEIWRALRQCSKEGEGAQLPALNHPVNTPSNAPILHHPTTGPSRPMSSEEGRAVTVGLMVTAFDHPVNTPSNAPILQHPTTGPSRPMSSEEGRAVTVGLMVTAFDQLTVQTDRLTGTVFDQLTVQTDRLTGTVKWFDWRKGYGFITPDSGGEDLFVHRSSIKSAGYQNLTEGDAVEFRIERRDDGRKAAVEVIGLGMSFVQETTTRGSDLIDSRKCYKCGETGHLARNCVVCYNCGKTGHLARNCSCTGIETDGNGSNGSDTGRYNNCSDTRKCYICGQTGHLTRNCVRCDNCGVTGHFARNCSYTGSPTGSNDFDGSGTGRYNYCSDTCKCYVCGEAGHLAKDCSHTRNRSDANNGSDIGRDDLCTDTHQNNCGETWHFARNRSYTGSESDDNDTQRGNHMIDTRDCYNCGKTGHLARNCPNMGSESDDKGDNTGSVTRRGNYHSDTRACYKCGRTGHLARYCSFSECSDTDNNDSDTSEGDQLVVQAEILTGTVKWFSKEKGYGFITPDGGDEDLFVHQSSIKSKGYRSLAQGEVIEFQIERGDDGRKKAVDVTGPGGSFVQGTARRQPYH